MFTTFNPTSLRRMGAESCSGGRGSTWCLSKVRCYLIHFFLLDFGAFVCVCACVCFSFLCFLLLYREFCFIVSEQQLAFSFCLFSRSSLITRSSALNPSISNSLSLLSLPLCSRPELPRRARPRGVLPLPARKNHPQAAARRDDPSLLVCATLDTHARTHAPCTACAARTQAFAPHAVLRCDATRCDAPR